MENKTIMSKEFINLKKAIHQYNKKYKNNCQFLGSFMAFKKDDAEIYDDIVFAYGEKKTLIMDLEEMLKMVKEEKNDFINW
jgi:hypothetical protein